MKCKTSDWNSKWLDEVWPNGLFSSRVHETCFLSSQKSPFLFSPLSLFFAYLRIFDFSLRSFFFSILRAYARSEFYLSRGERNRRIIRSDLAPLPSFRPDTKIFNPHVLVTTERGKKCKRSFRDFFLPLPPLPIFAMVYAMVMGNSFDRLRSAVICSDFQQECRCWIASVRYRPMIEAINESSDSNPLIRRFSSSPPANSVRYIYIIILILLINYIRKKKRINHRFLVHYIRRNC